MSDILNFISNNNLVSGLIVIIVGTMAGGVWKWYRDRRDSRKIYNFMLESKAGTGFTFRTTQAISSATKLPEKRVAGLCNKHPKIKRNEREKQSWRVIE